MTTRLLDPVITVDIDGDEYVPSAAEVTLDAGAVPYAEAEIELPFLDDETLEFLDWRDGVRCPISAANGSGTPRVFDLGVTGRTVDHAGKVVRVRVASDEVILQDYAPLTDDRTCLGLSSSLRSIVDYALNEAIPGASLEAGDDAAVTPVWSVTNLVGNGGFEGGSTAGYVAAVNVSGLTITTTAGFFKHGTQGLRYTSTAAGNSRLDVGATTGAFRATPGKTYTFAFEHRSGTARSGTIGIRFLNADGDVIQTSTLAFSSPSTQMSRFSHSAAAPAGTAFISPYIITISNSSGQFHYLDDVMIVEGEFLPDWFDGSTTDTATYDYSWAGATNASQSIRTLLVEGVAPEALVWEAGQTAWEFLLVLCATVSMTLWCDETRAWRLQTPESRTLGTLLTVNGMNTREGTDELSRDDTDAYVDGVVCVFEWTDRDGITHREVDQAGTAGRVLAKKFDQPYPGPGLAAAMLSRRQGTGRVQEVTAITRWDATPGMTVNVTLPGAPETQGRLASVTFHADGFMSIGLSGLVDILPGSIATLTGTIAALADTIADL